MVMTARGAGTPVGEALFHGVRTSDFARVNQVLRDVIGPRQVQSLQCSALGTEVEVPRASQPDSRTILTDREPLEC